MERSVVELENVHTGRDIYVIGSGPSAGHIAPEFFDNKIGIGVNEVYIRFPGLSYLVRKDARFVVDAYFSGIPLIVSRYNLGMTANNLNGIKVLDIGDPWPYYIFDHADNRETIVDLDVIGTDRIVVSLSTITSAMHIAALMGAANIILVGADCGTIDGQLNMSGYHDSTMGDERYRGFLAQIEPQSIAVRDRLIEVYGCNVYSLNPWINLGLEGHRYEHL